MARKALLVGINDYHSIEDLRGCINDVINMRELLKNYLGFRNEDIRVLADKRATSANILHRLEWMVSSASAGDMLVFSFSGHGSQIRDRNGDELQDHMDEILCTWDLDDQWRSGYIVDDQLENIFRKLPENVSLEVFLDCCHSGWDTAPSPVGTQRGIAQNPQTGSENTDRISKYLEPPVDILCRSEGDENLLKATQRFASKSGSLSRYTVWAGCMPSQVSMDAYIGGNYNGAFSYYFCKLMRERQGNVSREKLLENLRDSLRSSRYAQIPQLAVMDGTTVPEKRPLQFPQLDENRRLLFLARPCLRGQDVMEVQQALAGLNYDIEADGIFGPYTRVVVKKFQQKHRLLVDGVVGPAVLSALFG
ncbi:MAG: hypothetical protein GY862_34805 [Gammaproteobacteria bacterium]|nr:hypothetical protein [Gammaproteobacteria bacterium]